MLKNIKHYLNGYTNFLVAYSGGLDSTVLLHKLRTLNFFLRAIYINHNLSIYSNIWLKHCIHQCKKWNIPLIIENIHIFKKQGGIESLARNLRYNILFNKLKKNEVLLTAHHLDDQCETILLSLKRGSGPTGIAGIASTIKKNNKILLRPLLHFNKTQLLLYAKYHNLNWINDDSNNDIKFERNFLRKKIIPIITKKWPFFNKTISRSAELCWQQELLLDEFLKKFLIFLIQKNGSLLITPLLNKSSIFCYAIIRRWLRFHNIIMPSKAILNQIIFQFIRGKLDKKSPCVKFNKYSIQRDKKAIHLIPQYPSVKNFIIKWNKPWNPIILPANIGIILIHEQGLRIRKPLNNENITIRFYTKQKINILNSYKNKKIKKIWKNFSIPIWNRQRIPLLFYNEILISAINIFITQEGFSKKKSLSWRIFWKKN